MWAGSAMLPTGLLILAFVLLHLADLTVGASPGASATFVHPADGGSPYANLVASFARPWAAAAYVGTMLALAAHVWHGTLLAANDLGATGARTRRVAAWVGGLAAVAILLGNAGIPLAVQMGALR